MTLIIEAFSNFVDASFEAVLPKQVGETFSKLAKAFGYEAAMVADLRELDLSFASTIVFSTPFDTANGRTKKANFTIHPLLSQAITTDRPFSLQTLCETYGLLETRMRAWMPEPLRKGDILSLPVHRNGKLVLYAGCGGASVAAGPRTSAMLHTAAHIVFDRINHMANPALLTGREADCLQLAAQGKTYQEIARSLKLSSRTVRAAIATAKARLNAKTKAEAIAKAVALTEA